MSIFRFSLKTAFLATTIAALCLGLWLHGYRSGISESFGHVESKVRGTLRPELSKVIETSTSKTRPVETPRLPG